MVLTRDQLLDLTRGRAAQPFDRSIDNQVSRLRKKIEPDPKEPELIKTAWGGGYSFAAEVTSCEARGRGASRASSAAAGPDADRGAAREPS